MKVLTDSQWQMLAGIAVLLPNFGEVDSVLSTELAAMRQALAREKFCEEHRITVQCCAASWCAIDTDFPSMFKYAMTRTAAIDALMQAFAEQENALQSVDFVMQGDRAP